MKRLLFIIFVIAGCSSEPFVPYEPEWNVFLVIRNDTENHVCLDRTHPINEDKEITTNRIVMKIELPESSYVYQEEFDSLGIFRLPDSLPVVYGGEYKLYLWCDVLGELHGEMTLPVFFKILYPGNGSTIGSIDSIVIHSNGVSRFRFLFLNSEGEEVLNLLSDEVEDTIFIQPLKFISFLDTGLYTIKVMGMEENYAGYFFNTYYYTGGAERYGIDTGVGVFGGMVVETLRVRIVGH